MNIGFRPTRRLLGRLDRSRRQRRSSSWPSDAAQAEEAKRQLLRVGLDDVVGYVAGGFEAWQAAGGKCRAWRFITRRELRDRLQRP